MRNYGRGIARKAAFTKKCSCDAPHWSKNFIEVNDNTKEISYVLSCRNCKAYWSTKSHDARKFWEKDMDTIPITWMGYGYSGKQTVRELFKDHDMDRLKYLESEQAELEKKLSELQKEIEKAQKAVNKYKKMMEEF